MTRHPTSIFKAIAAIAIAVIVWQSNAFSEVNDDRTIFLSKIPAYTGNVILGRPTDSSVTASVMMNSKSKIFIGYGTEGAFDRRTETVELIACEPKHILISGFTS